MRENIESLIFGSIIVLFLVIGTIFRIPLGIIGWLRMITRKRNAYYHLGAPIDHMEMNLKSDFVKQQGLFHLAHLQYAGVEIPYGGIALCKIRGPYSETQVRQLTRMKENNPELYSMTIRSAHQEKGLIKRIREWI